MTDFLTKIFPIILFFLIGYSSKVVSIFHKSTGKILIRLVFYFTLPALVFLSVVRTNLQKEYFFLPLFPFVVVGITFVIAYYSGKRLNISSQAFGTYLVGSMIMNTGFTMPFVIAAFGKTGLVIYTFFDFGNSLLIFTFIYFFAIKFGNNNGEGKIPLRKFLLLPPIWGLLIGLAMNIFHFTIPKPIMTTLEMIGAPTVFLVMFSLGLYFSPKSERFSLIFPVILIRIGVGLLIGYLLTLLFSFHGTIRTLVIIFSGAPVGYNTLVFASLEKLDEDYAASLVSLSLILGFIYVPLLLLLL